MLVRSSQTSRSSIGLKLVDKVFGRCERSDTLSRERQRVIVLTCTPNSRASALAGAELDWM